ncbi:MAG: DUF4956 domain-containing protein [Bacteroidaceae bacterium]|nr:DUF4956 domain-containing protein [Bacteroidaceae bacterium]
MELTDFFGKEFIAMLHNLALNVVVSFIIVQFLYYKKSQRRDFYFTFMMISVAIFFLVFYMIFALEDMKAKTSMGIGIGLFGIFSIMRYRTDAMPVREMTYLFIIIALSVVNAVSAEVKFGELIFANVFILLATWLCETFIKIQSTKLIQYDRIELIRPDKHDELLEDLKKRTGLDIQRVDVGAIDFLRDMAMLKIHYTKADQTGSNSTDQKIKLRNEDLMTV